MGNIKPITLVRMVVNRNSPVQPMSRFEANMPNSTISPLTTAIKLMATCTIVNTSSGNPKIMAQLLWSPLRTALSFAAVTSSAKSEVRS
jgi:hypothetical protein